MIAKKQAVKAEHDNYRRLARYIADADNQGEKALTCWCAGCDEDYGKGIEEVEDTQSLNTRSKKEKTCHLIIGFHPEDESRLTPEIFQEIEKEFARSLGFEEHQRHCGVHKNTGSLHMHIAYNMIHPEKLTRKAPYRDYRILSAVCKDLEQRYDLFVVDGRAEEKTGQTKIGQKAAAMEAHSGQQSFQSYALEHREAVLKKLETADSWQSLHEVFAGCGMEVKPRGAGLIIKDRHGRHAIKASEMDRSLSLKKLESRYGAYVSAQGLDDVRAVVSYSARPLHKDPERGGLYAEWREIKARRVKLYMAARELKAREKELKAAVHEKWERQRVELRQEGLLRGHYYDLLQKSRLYEADELKRKSEGIRGEMAAHRASLQEQAATWTDFLRSKAAQGSEIALAVLRSDKISVEAEAAPEQAPDFERIQEVRNKWRRKRVELSDTLKYGRNRKGLLSVARAYELEELEKLDPNAPALFTGFTSDIDAKGTVLIKLASGGMIRDTGKEIRFSAHDPTARAAALRFARAKWGKPGRLEGNQIRRETPEQTVRYAAPREMQEPHDKTQDSGRGR